MVFTLQLFENEWNRRRSGNDSDEEDPPLETIYRRSCKDKTKLLILAPLYFILMVIAAVIAFYSIETVIVSYQHRVRTVQYITVDEYHTIGIALFPQNFAKFNRCEFLYGDDLAPHKHNWSVIQPPYQACNYTHVTFRSRLVNQNRTAVIFHGPTLVKWKQSLAIHFRIDTTVREFSAIEYLLLEEWHTKMNESPDVQADYLAEMEYTMPLFTLPAGFRSWVKMAYVIRNDGPGSKNLSDFVITSDFATYTGWYNSDSKNNSAPIYALFEWKTNTYEYFTEILSTTIWNTVGSLTGVFVALMKAGEYCQKLVQRIRRDRKKKQLKLKELEEERQKKVSEHQRKQRSKLLREGSPLEDVTA